MIRWQECVEVVSRKLPLSVQFLYSVKYYDEEIKFVLDTVITKIGKKFENIIEEVSSFE